MAGMLEFSDQEFKTTMINRLRAPMKKADNMQEQMGSISRDMEVLRKKKKRGARDQNTVTEIKSAFGGFIGRLRLELAEDNISELEGMSIVISKTEKQGVKNMEKKTEQTIQKLWDNYKRCSM